MAETKFRRTIRALARRARRAERFADRRSAKTSGATRGGVPPPSTAATRHAPIGEAERHPSEMFAAPGQADASRGRPVRTADGVHRTALSEAPNSAHGEPPAWAQPLSAPGLGTSTGRCADHRPAPQESAEDYERE